MLGVFLASLTGLIGFILMTIIYMPVICFLGEERGSLLARKKLRGFSRALLRAVAARVEIIYKDEDAIRRLDRNNGVVLVGNHQSNMDIPLISG